MSSSISRSPITQAHYPQLEATQDPDYILIGLSVAYQDTDDRERQNTRKTPAPTTENGRTPEKHPWVSAALLSLSVPFNVLPNNPQRTPGQKLTGMTHYHVLRGRILPRVQCA